MQRSGIVEILWQWSLYCALSWVPKKQNIYLYKMLELKKQIQLNWLLENTELGIENFKI